MTAIVPPSGTQLPQPPDSIDYKSLGSLCVYLNKLVLAITNAFDGCLRKNRPVDSVLLTSASGSVYKLYVSNTGTVMTTVVYQAP